MRISFVTIAMIFLSGITFAQKDFQWMEGDLLFQNSDCGAFCDAINKVTEGINGLDFSHVGILTKNENGSWEVLEAISEGVVKTPLDIFLQRSLDKNNLPKVVVGRIKDQYSFLINDALEEKEDHFLGKEYDDIFDINNDLYYCSELVYFLYRDKDDHPFFKLRPMTFIDPDTEETFDIWIDYYEKLGHPIPEGQPGLNPGGISRSEKLEIFFPFSKFNLK